MVVDLPLWKIWVRQLGWSDDYSQLNGKIKNVPNHQPDCDFKAKDMPNRFWVSQIVELVMPPGSPTCLNDTAKNGSGKWACLCISPTDTLKGTGWFLTLIFFECPMFRCYMSKWQGPWSRVRGPQNEPLFTSKLVVTQQKSNNSGHPVVRPTYFWIYLVIFPQMAWKRTLCTRQAPDLPIFKSRTKHWKPSILPDFPINIIDIQRQCSYLLSGSESSVLRRCSNNVRPPSYVSWFRFAPVTSSSFAYHKP